ncbi:MAG: MerR family transcriptional regulator, partial [Cellulosilyticaceae bacterium]
MKEKSYMTIKEFSKLTGIKPENLRYYHQIKLLSPDYRGENGYRYYSRNQLNTAYLIISLREIGISIDEIKAYMEGRTPDKMFALFKSQEAHILNEMKKLQSILEVMKLYSSLAEDALKYDENTMLIAHKSKEPILLGPTISTKSIDNAMISFYDFAAKNDFNIGYPLGAIINHDNLISNETLEASNYYFKVEKNENHFKPEGQYAVIYGKCA